MRCGRCRRPGASGARFCAACGAPLAAHCHACDARLTAPGAPCPRCGGATRPAEGSLPGDVERRSLTILFCDLIDSTELAQTLDLEDLRAVIRAYHALCGEVLERFRGHTAQYLGDGLLVYFGFPRADPDDALHAVRAGLTIVRRLRRLNEQLERAPGVHLAARIAIHTGPVVIGHLGHAARSDVLALGEAVNVAARLQGVAGAGSVVISEDTLRLVQGRFVCESLGRLSLRGVRRPIVAHRVLQGAGAASVLDASPPGGWPSLVGRERELRTIEERWSLAAAGSGQTLVIQGEAGSGKTRLAKALREHLTGSAHTWLECRGEAEHREAPYHPVVELLESAVGVSRTASPEERFDQLTEAMELWNLDAARGAPLIGPLFGAQPRAPGRLGSPVSAGRVREILRRWMLEIARRQPLVILVDDVQWLDDSTLGLLDELAAHVAGAAVLLLVLERPDSRHAWPPGVPVTTVRLAPLPPAESVALARACADGSAVPPAVAQRIAMEAGGIPLFVEELVRSWSAEATEPGAQAPRTARPDPRDASVAAVPARLEPVLRAQLDRLGPAQAVAQACAVLGPEFTADLASRVLEQPPAEVQASLDALEGADVLRCSAGDPAPRYRFRNALLRAVAYGSLLRERRRALHREACRALEGEAAPPAGAGHAARIAQHYEGAGDAARAIETWERAAQACLVQHAPGEAIAQLRRAVALVDHLAPGRERLATELRLQLRLAVPLQMKLGYGSDEAERCFRRARDLGRRLGDSQALFSTLAGLSAFHLLRADLRVALEVAHQAMRLAAHQNDRALQLWGRYGVGIVSLYLGDLDRACDLQEAGLRFATDPAAAGLRGGYAGDPGVDCRLHAGLLHWLRGEDPEMRRLVAEALALGTADGRPAVLATALALASVLAQLAGRARRAAHLSARARAAATEAEAPLWLGLAESVAGWTRVQAGDADEGLNGILAGAARLHGTGARLGQTYLYALQAQAHLVRGEPGDAREAAEAGLAAVEDRDERYCEAELWRLQGAALAATDPKAAACCLDRALEVARRQHARAWERRVRRSQRELLPKPQPNAIGAP